MKTIFKKQFAKVFLLGILIITSNLYSQTGLENSSPTKNKAISLGVFACAPPSYSGAFGGNIKLEYTKNKKLGLGIKLLASGNNSGHIINGYDYSFEKEKSFSYLLADLTATYYILGNYNESKGGLYSELGLGYHRGVSEVEYQNYWFYNGINTNSYNGLGGHISIGGNRKLGPGKIYLELIAGTTLFGSVEENWSNPNFLAQLNVSSPNTKSIRFFPGDHYNGNISDMYILGITLGYSLNF